MVIKGGFTLEMDDPEAFVQDTYSVTGVETALASSFGVDLSMVTVTLAVGARRLSTRQLSAGSVSVSYVITIPAGSFIDVAKVKQAVTLTGASAIASAITSAMKTLDPTKTYSVSVTSISAPQISSGATSTSTSTATPGTASSSDCWPQGPSYTFLLIAGALMIRHA